MSHKQKTSKQYFRTLTVLFFAMLGGQIVFAGVALLFNLVLGIAPSAEVLRDILIYIVPVFMVGGILAGQKLYRHQIKRGRSFTELTGKMGAYRSAMFIRLAMTEGASFFTIIAYMITADLLFLAMTGFMIVYFLMLKPTPDKIAKELELSHEEKSKILNPDEIIAVGINA